MTGDSIPVADPATASVESKAVPSAFSSSQMSVESDKEGITPTGSPTPVPGAPTSTSPSKSEGKRSADSAGLSQSGGSTKQTTSASGSRRVFPCEECSTRCNSRAGLEKHVQAVHKRLKQYQCPECRRWFAWKSHLIVHLKKIHNVLSYPCNSCGRSFATKRDLREHSHNECSSSMKYLYACMVCDHTSASREESRQHFREVHARNRQDLSLLFDPGWLATMPGPTQMSYPSQGISAAPWPVHQNSAVGATDHQWGNAGAQYSYHQGRPAQGGAAGWGSQAQPMHSDMYHASQPKTAPRNEIQNQGQPYPSQSAPPSHQHSHPIQAGMTHNMHNTAMYQPMSATGPQHPGAVHHQQQHPPQPSLQGQQMRPAPGAMSGTGGPSYSPVLSSQHAQGHRQPLPALAQTSSANVYQQHQPNPQGSANDAGRSYQRM